MVPLSLALREATNADWTSTIVLPAAGAVPWAAVPAWSSVTQYTAASAVVQLGNLVVSAVSAPTLGTFLPAEWTIVGRATDYTAAPYDLTGADVRLYVADFDSAGDPVPEQVRLKLTKIAGTLVATPAQRTVALKVPALKVQAIPAGTYAVDLLAEKSGGITRLAAGTLTVDQGVTR